MKKALKISLLCFIPLIYGCINSDNVVGMYVAKNLVNNIDTLRVLKDGTYSKDIYRKKDNSLIYHNAGKWDYEDGRITLHDFFQDEDQVYIKEAGNFENSLITCALLVKKRWFRTVIYYRQLTENSYYEKQ